MKNKYFLIILPLVIIFSFNGKKYDEAVIERLSVLVRVCLEGEDCGVSSQSSGMTSSMSIVPINETKKVELSEGSEHVVKMLNSGDGGQMIFEPAVLKVSKGDTIHFKATDMSHNSASIDGMLPEGAAAWAGAMNTDISVTLDTEGIYVYQCDPHAMMAMIGVIQVGEATNMDAIKQASNSYKSSFIMNTNRIDDYLNQL